MYRGSVNEVGSDELLNISSRPLGQRILRDKEDIFCNYPGKRTSPSNTPSNPPNTHQQQPTHPPQTSSPTHNTDQSIGRQTASNTTKKNDGINPKMLRWWKNWLQTMKLADLGRQRWMLFATFRHREVGWWWREALVWRGGKEKTTFENSSRCDGFY